MKNQVAKFVFFYSLLLFIQFVSLSGQFREDRCLQFFEYIDEENDVKTVDFRQINCAAIFVFGEQCLSCNKNVPFWNRLAQLPGLYSLALVAAGRTEMDYGFKFRTVQALDLSSFKRNLNLREGVDYTLVVKKGAVVHIVYGMLTPKDFLEIKSLGAE